MCWRTRADSGGLSHSIDGSFANSTTRKRSFEQRLSKLARPVAFPKWHPVSSKEIEATMHPLFCAILQLDGRAKSYNLVFTLRESRLHRLVAGVELSKLQR